MADGDGQSGASGDLLGMAQLSANAVQIIIMVEEDVPDRIGNTAVPCRFMGNRLARGHRVQEQITPLPECLDDAAHPFLVGSKAAAHVVVDANVTGHLIQIPINTFLQLGFRHAAEQHVRAGIDCRRTGLHRDMQHQFVSGLTGIRSLFCKVFSIGHEGQGQWSRQVDGAARTAAGFGSLVAYAAEFASAVSSDTNIDDELSSVIPEILAWLILHAEHAEEAATMKRILAAAPQLACPVANEILANFENKKESTDARDVVERAIQYMSTLIQLDEGGDKASSGGVRKAASALQSLAEKSQNNDVRKLASALKVTIDVVFAGEKH